MHGLDIKTGGRYNVNIFIYHHGKYFSPHTLLPFQIFLDLSMFSDSVAGKNKGPQLCEVLNDRNF